MSTEGWHVTSFIGVLVYHHFGEFWCSADWEPRGRTSSDLAVRATGRPPSRIPLSQSAPALLNFKAFNLSIKVHQNGASADNPLPSSTLEQLVHLSFMLHAYQEWLHRQVSLLVSCL